MTLTFYPRPLATTLFHGSLKTLETIPKNQFSPNQSQFKGQSANSDCQIGLQMKVASQEIDHGSDQMVPLIQIYRVHLEECIE